MNCPSCKDVSLVMSERQGVEIDYCPQCRGVWLDRGELDKIIDRSERELAAVPAAAPPTAQPFLPPQGGDPYRWGGDCDDRSRQGHHGGYRKKSVVEGTSSTSERKGHAMSSVVTESIDSFRGVGMSHGWKEIAKFACGVEAFHALMHTYFWYSGKSLSAFGVTETPTWHKRAAIANALTALALGIYAYAAMVATPGPLRGTGLPRDPAR